MEFLMNHVLITRNLALGINNDQSLLKIVESIENSFNSIVYVMFEMRERPIYS